MKGRKTILNNKEEQIYKKQEKLNMKMPLYYQESLKKMPQHGEKAESVIRMMSLFKAPFMTEDGLRMVENMNGRRKMKPMWMKKSFTSEFLQNIGDTSLLI